MNDDPVMLLFNQGIAPSEIDRRLHKPDGYSHDYVVWWWRVRM